MILLIYITIKKLPWNYVSQAIGMLFVEVGAVLIIMWARTGTTRHAITGTDLYPIAIVLIWGIGQVTWHWSRIETARPCFITKTH
jgi:hypothetical protein